MNDLIYRSSLMGKDGLFTKRGCPGQCQHCNLWSEEGCRVILEAPAVEARPVVHGRWLYDSYAEKYFCSACNEEAIYSSRDVPEYDYDWEENLRYSHTETIFEEHLTKFCPHCGATMDLESEGTDE